MQAHLRIARPVGNLAVSRALYCQGLGLQVLGSFVDHAGFDGVMLGRAGMDYHLEFTQCTAHPVAPAPTAEDLLVFYLPDPMAWQTACANMTLAGFQTVTPLNPYWAQHGRSFADPDGYRVVLQQAPWRNLAATA